jgi:hypothetical protein
LLLAALFFLPGCFDSGLELELKPQGGGALTLSLTVPQGLEEDVEQDEVAEILKPNPQYRKKAGQGVVEFIETASFSHLDTLVARRARFQVKRTNMGLLGIGDNTYRLTGWVRATEGDRPDRDMILGTELDHKHQERQRPGEDDPASRRARQLLAASLAGHHLKVVFKVPGSIVEAWPLEMGAERVDPKLGPGESLVTWRIPLALLANARVRHTMVFRVDFKGEYRFRAENTTETISQFHDDPRIK